MTTTSDNDVQQEVESQERDTIRGRSHAFRVGPFICFLEIGESGIIKDGSCTCDDYPDIQIKSSIRSGDQQQKKCEHLMAATAAVFSEASENDGMDVERLE